MRLRDDLGVNFEYRGFRFMVFNNPAGFREQREYD